MQLPTLILFFLPIGLFAQVTIQGIITDTHGQPIMAAHIYWCAHPQTGTFSQANGTFELTLPAIPAPDSCIHISALGFQSQEIMSYAGRSIVLVPNEYTLQAVTVEAQDPVSEAFLLTKQEKLDIYFNPTASGDVLRSLITLPASTNTAESANPTLRGSSADRSRVLLNGVPIFRPVRNTQINGIGNFSLFHTELLHAQYIYPSNPPLTRGNAIAGVVAIETTKKLRISQSKVSAGLAHIGIFRDQKLGERAFIQAYANHQFSRWFIGINQAGLSNLKAFRNQDAGINIHLKNKQGWTLDALAYGIEESYQIQLHTFGRTGHTHSSQQRHFHTLRLRKPTPKGIFSFHHGFDLSQRYFRFNTLDSKQTERSLYSAIDWRHRITKHWEWQSGIVHQLQYYRANDHWVPSLLEPPASHHTINQQDTLQQRRFEMYQYLRYTPKGKWSFQVALRGSLNAYHQRRYISSQASARWQIAPQKAMLFSGGQYHSYSLPAPFDKHIRLLRSQQFAIDYDWVTTSDQHIHLAAYAKKESGQFNSALFTVEDYRKIYGLEAQFKQPFGQFLQTQISATYLLQDITKAEFQWSGTQDRLLFLKAIIQFKKANFLDTSLNYIWHNGLWEIPRSEDEPFGAFPFHSAPQPERLGAYGSLNLSISRYIMWKNNHSLVVYGNLTNLLNQKNIQSIRYNEQFARTGWNYFQRRTIYAGLVLSL